MADALIYQEWPLLGSNILDRPDFVDNQVSLIYNTPL